MSEAHKRKYVCSRRGRGGDAREKVADHQERTGEEEEEREHCSQSASPCSHLRLSGVLTGWVAPVDDFIISARTHTHLSQAWYAAISWLLWQLTADH
jgi:hypothetical protein